MSDNETQVQFWIERGREHSLHLDDDILDGYALMAPAYRAALLALKGIVASGLSYCRTVIHPKPSERVSDSSRREAPSFLEYQGGDSELETSLYEYPSSLIVFCGDRGQGKSSTLLSFVHAFQNWNTRENEKHWELARYLQAGDSYDARSGESGYREREDFPRSRDYRRAAPFDGAGEGGYREREDFPRSRDYRRAAPFDAAGERTAAIDYIHVLPPVEPNIMGGQDTVMSVILSKLFFQTERILRDFDVQDAQRERLLRAFRKCYQEARTLQASSGEFVPASGRDSVSMDDLYQLGDSLDLKSDFYFLLRQFFRVQGKDPDRSFLMVSLDDTDLQFRRAYEILEDIRKYLFLPNVVVVMGTHMEQLRKLVIQRYYTVLREAVDRHEIQPKEIRLMASKYLDKLIPAAHAIYLPDIRSVYQSQPSLPLTVSQKSYGDLQQSIFEMLYRKTWLVFIRDGQRMHGFTPQTLRGINHLWRLLDTMPDIPELPVLDVKSDDWKDFDPEEWTRYCRERLDCVRVQSANLQTFENYFLNDWCNARLNKPYCELLQELDRNALPSQTVAYAADIVKYRLDSARHEVEFDERPVRDAITSVYEKPLRGKFTYSDLNELIAELDEMGHTRDESVFGFALHVYLSIQLHKQAAGIQKEELEKELNRNVSTLARDLPHEAFHFLFWDIADRLKPQLFNSEKLQFSYVKNRFFAHLNNYSVSFLHLFGYNADTANLDLLNCFLQSLRGTLTISLLISQRASNEPSPYQYYYKQSPYDQSAIINLQDLALYVCCNWDVQDKISQLLSGASLSPQVEWSLWLRDDLIKDSTPERYVNAFFDAIFRCLWRLRAPGIDALLQRIPDGRDWNQDGDGQFIPLPISSPLDFVSAYLPPSLRDEELKVVAAFLEERRGKTEGEQENAESVGGDSEGGKPSETPESAESDGGDSEGGKPSETPESEEESAESVGGDSEGGKPSETPESAESDGGDSEGGKPSETPESAKSGGGDSEGGKP